MKKIFILFFLLFFTCPFFALAEQIDINTATLQQLDKLTGIGPAYAQKIIDARPFASVDDLIRVKGIGEKTLQKVKDQGLACVNCGTSDVPQTTIEETTTTEPIKALTEPIKEPAETRSPPIYQIGVVINELLPSPEGADEENEWIELYNTNNFEVDISGWKIEDIEGTKTTHLFINNTKISANGYLLFKRPDTKITLNNSKDGLNLLWPNDKIVDSLLYEAAPINQSYNKTYSGWQWSTYLTPGNKNIILAVKTKDIKQSLPNSQKSGNSNKIEEGLATVSQNINQEKTKNNNPWFLIFIAMIITIISALFVLFIKFKLNNNVRT
jgi:competence ComEA-like helix-hairpin-helix protein